MNLWVLKEKMSLKRKARDDVLLVLKMEGIVTEGPGPLEAGRGKGDPFPKSS